MFSPHLDDAALSAFEVLSSAPRPRVVTVFAGIPEDGFVTDLDRSHGATDSAEWIRTRRRHDAAALTPLGAEVVQLDLPEVQFAAYRIPRIREAIRADPLQFLATVSQDDELRTDPFELVELMRSQLVPGAAVYGPTGIGGHPDHRDLAAATVALASLIGTVHLYADSPYVFFDAVPSRLAGDDHDWTTDLVQRALGSLLAGPTRLERRVVELDPETLERKMNTLSRYATEMPGLLRDLDRIGASVDVLRFEVYWTIEHE